MEAADETVEVGAKLRPRVAWEIDSPPLRPALFLAREINVEEIANRAEIGIGVLTPCYDFARRKDLNYTRKECRVLLEREAQGSSLTARGRADLMAALMSDAAIKDDKEDQTLALA